MTMECHPTSQPDDEVNELHQKIQEQCPIPGGGVLVGWVTIAEWARPDGGRAVAALTGPEEIAPWTVLGLIHFHLAALESDQVVTTLMMHMDND